MLGLNKLSVILVVMLLASLYTIKVLYDNTTEYKDTISTITLQANRLRLSKDSQLDAYKAILDKERAERKKLNFDLIELEKVNEKIKCPVPNFVIDAFERM